MSQSDVRPARGLTPRLNVGPRRFYRSVTTAAYLRVSTGQQSIDQQHDAIAAAGITPDRVFTDTASGRAGSCQRRLKIDPFTTVEN